MKLQIFSLYDKKALAYMNPFFYSQIGQAIRSLEDLLQSDNPVSKHPADFDIYKLGEYDDVTGEIKPIIPPQHLQTALSLITNQNLPNKMVKTVPSH